MAEFLSKNQAIGYIINSESKYPNLKLNKKSMYPYKYGSSKSMVEILNNSILDFTLQEQMHIKRIYNSSIQKINKFNKFPDIKIKFIKVNNYYEFGYPHTVNTSVVLPQRSVYLSEETMIHEIIHIYQRIIPESFEKLYNKKYNFTKLNKPIDMTPENWFVVNPDGVNVEWQFKLNNNTYLIPFAYYVNGGVETYCYIVKNGELIYRGSINTHYAKDYNHKFSKIPQTYHPNEISAIDLTNYILYGEYLV